MIRDSFSAVPPRHAKITGIRSIVIYLFYTSFTKFKVHLRRHGYVCLLLQAGFAGCLLIPEPE
jgi:hypothetical protein